MDTLYYNGDILTMATHIPQQALLVRDGRVAAVGAFEPLLEADPYCHKVDLQGACMMPAFLDAHSHIVSWAMGKLQADLSGAADFPAIAAAMAEFARRRGIAPGQWVIGRGADMPLDESLVAELDRALPDHPALVQHASSHGGVFNTAARKALGLSRGALVENPYIEAQKKVPMPDLAELTAAFREAQEDYLSHGYILAQEGCMMEEAARLYAAFAAAGAIQMAIVSYGQPDMACDRGPIPTVGLSNRGNKIFLDGSPQQRTAFLREPYVGGGLGEATMTEEEVLAAVRCAGAAGRQLLAHCNGDAAIDRFLWALEEADYPGALRPVIVHAQLLGGGLHVQRQDRLRRGAGPGGTAERMGGPAGHDHRRGLAVPRGEGAGHIGAGKAGGSHCAGPKSADSGAGGIGNDPGAGRRQRRADAVAKGGVAPLFCAAFSSAGGKKI